jgi:flavin reductase (DIM6/NTAB) family NADH-FMN oxidoreductase RutF
MTDSTPPPCVPDLDYRTLMSGFPTGVAVITGTDGAIPCGLTCSSLSSVTMAPPTLQVCVQSRSRVLPAVRERGAFAVNLLHARARHIAAGFAAPVADRFAGIVWSGSPRLGVPWLTEAAFAMAECRLVATLVVGDHTMLLGEVVSTRYVDDVPLLYGKRRYSAWPEPVEPIGS